MTDPFKTIEMLAHERNEMLANLTRTQERLARYIEVGRCAKVLIEANRAAEEDAHGSVTDNTVRMCEAVLELAVQALELGPEGASMQTPPVEATGTDYYSTLTGCRSSAAFATNLDIASPTAPAECSMSDDQFIRGVPRGVVYTDAGLRRIADAAWNILHLLPHPDDEPEWAAQIREFNRALQNLQPLEKEPKR